jgi:hypothetical protein
MSRDLTTPDQAIDDLLHAVGEAMERVPLPERGAAGELLERYLGDVVDITFSGDDEQRVELLARLLMLARVATAERQADLRTTAWLRRLERPLRRWERGRLQGTANPRPRPDEVDARVAMFGAAQGPDAIVAVDTVALAVAELVAVHQLAGATSLEEGVAAREAIRPLVEEAAALLRGRDTLGDGVYDRPGATLAHVEHATWQIMQILQHAVGEDELPWLRALWLEVAAALVFAYDVYERRADHAERWRAVHDLAAEKLTVGGLVADASGFDVRATILLVRAVALQLSGVWLDEARGGSELPSASMFEDRLQAAAAQALLAAWAAGRRLG